jgi:O-glycosyl hydrolase
MKPIKLSLAIALSAALSFSAEAQAQQANKLVISIDAKNTKQTIHNFGASGCWFSEGIGKYWPVAKRERMAELLFSKEKAADGSFKGIGLSAWRFNIGGGTAEQGDSSGIKDFRKRVESFLAPDGTYDWNKQTGYQWFLRKAKDYGVENLIAFSNTPPVQFTQNGLGFKTVKDYKGNLKPDKYNDYADFLTEVIKHFDQQGLHFNYISPVNEPQWDWSNKPVRPARKEVPGAMLKYIRPSQP